MTVISREARLTGRAGTTEKSVAWSNTVAFRIILKFKAMQIGTDFFTHFNSTKSVNIASVFEMTG